MSALYLSLQEIKGLKVPIGRLPTYYFCNVAVGLLQPPKRFYYIGTMADTWKNLKQEGGRCCPCKGHNNPIYMKNIIMVPKIKYDYLLHRWIMRMAWKTQLHLITKISPTLHIGE